MAEPSRQPQGDDVRAEPGADPSVEPAADSEPPFRSRYLVPFSMMGEWLNRSAPEGSRQLEMKYDDFLDIVRHVLVAIPVDEDWYRATYPGVAAEIAAGTYVSAAHHFALHGYFEDRRPFESETASRRLPAPFPALKASLHVVPVRRGLRLQVDYDTLLQVIRHVLEAVPVDEAWYRAAYPGVSDAIADGTFSCAAQHFVEHGYFECRWPFEMAVDEEWYLTRYPDAKADVEQGLYASARDHFWAQGYAQGRLPGKFWFAVLWDRDPVVVV